MSEATGGFDHLLDLVRQARRNEGRTVPAIACPRDGEPLETARGVRHCPSCGWTSGTASNGG